MADGNVPAIAPVEESAALDKMQRMTRILQEQWKQPLASGFARNTPVLENIAAAVRDGASIIELIGLVGTGKTTLLQTIEYDRPAWVDGTVEYFVGSSSFPLSDAIDVIADRFRGARGNHLLVIDGAELLEKGDILGSINRLATGPWRFSTILATTAPLDIGRPVYLTPLNYEEMSGLFEAQLGQPMSVETLRRLWAASQGQPRLAEMLVGEWRNGRVRNVDALAELLNPLAAPGLVDVRGRPLSRGSHEEKAIISDVRFVSDALLKAVGDDPQLVHALTPREFEELSAELFQRQGYQVTLTPQTRDGGKDLYMARADGFGSFLYIVECKRYAPDNPVNVGVVRSLYGVAQHERVTAAMTLTTSYFSKDALDFAAEVQYQLALKDFIDLKLLLQPYSNG